MRFSRGQLGPGGYLLISKELSYPAHNRCQVTVDAVGPLRRARPESSSESTAVVRKQDLAQILVLGTFATVTRVLLLPLRRRGRGRLVAEDNVEHRVAVALGEVG